MPIFNRFSLWSQGSLSMRLSMYAGICIALGFIACNSLSAQAPPSYAGREVLVGVTTPAGPIGRYTVNLNGNLAVETSFSDQPFASLRLSSEYTLLGGLKAGMRRGRWGLFGTVEPGLSLRPDDDIQYGNVNNCLCIVSNASERSTMNWNILLGPARSTSARSSLCMSASIC